MNIKSPFLVFQDFIDPDYTQELAKRVRVDPSIDDEGQQQAMIRHATEEDLPLYDRLLKLVPKFENHFTGFSYKGTENLVYQQFPMSSKNAEEPHCENAVYKRKKWIRVRDRDLTGILWLKDYKDFQDSQSFDVKKNVLGGKLEFPVYNFGFQPQAGTLVVYPASERFISLTTPILVGELQCVRFHITGHGIWLYDPVDYPGDFRTWFNDVV